MRRKFALLLSFSAILLFLDYFRLGTSLMIPFEAAITRIKRSIYQNTFKLKFLPAIISDYQDLTLVIAERRRLDNENLSLKLSIDKLERENTDLKNQLGAPLSSKYRQIPAEVISVTRQMEIEAGENEGVTPGMAVVDGNVFIGVVSKVTKARSLVTLATDSNLSVPVITSRGTRGNIGGQLNAYVLFADILQKDPLFIEDTLMTTGEGGFPKDLLIGKVVRIEGDDVAVYKKAQVKPFTDPNNVATVYVLEET